MSPVSMPMVELKDRTERLDDTLRAVPPMTPSAEKVLRAVRAWEEAVGEIGRIILEYDRYIGIILAATQDDPAYEEMQRLLPHIRESRRRAFALMATAIPDQAWFWTEEWQAGERRADADIAAGRTTFHAPTGDFLQALEDRRHPRADTWGRRHILARL